MYYLLRNVLIKHVEKRHDGSPEPPSPSMTPSPLPLPLEDLRTQDLVTLGRARPGVGLSGRWTQNHSTWVGRLLAEILDLAQPSVTSLARG